MSFQGQGPHLALALLRQKRRLSLRARPLRLLKVFEHGVKIFHQLLMLRHVFRLILVVHVHRIRDRLRQSLHRQARVSRHHAELFSLFEVLALLLIEETELLSLPFELASERASIFDTIFC